MRCSDIFDEVSAYIDGEADDPDAVKRHLAECPACAEEFVQMRKASAMMKAAPAPEPHPAFATRITALAAATPRRRWFGKPSHILWPVAAAAAAVILVAIFLRIQTVPPTPNNAPSDPAVLVQTLAQAAADPEEFAAPETELTAMAQTDWFNSLSNKWEEDADIESLVLALDDTQKAALLELLEQYQTEGNTT